MQNLPDLIQNLKAASVNLKREISKVIVGQDEIINQMLTALFANGHVLIEGVPGLAKTLMISSLAKALSLSFSRIQFTPDLMPSDITGTDILISNQDTGAKGFEYLKGPVFANMILADEINRTPPKTQSALLQAMQENTITSGNKTWKLEKPFIVMATQNPIEQEGTYPLPEAQLDRFMFYITIGYPSYEEEMKIVQSTTGLDIPQISAQLNASEIVEVQKAIRSLPVSDHVLKYAVDLVRRSRPNSEDADSEIKKWVSWGAGPRASQYLVLGAKAVAAMDGRLSPSEDDVRRVAQIVLRHRILVSFAAEAEGITSSDIVTRLLK
ncbi:MAG: MoxR family ATPase [Candidatus Cloacimonetes bacterium]|jgi:MoxR-like ATPase|nr:MoxR family ATPase [Candidatus Cloacimonadota bacterium]MDY0336896.1 MoxR family ATPase [Candidatus Cloacimonadaceae bacterium]MCB5268874.1 MoxR family ATPase [Candidatus Cloacimonadota bacterium]MDD2543417.1 MoxR family ATPase [Candidatus Cloacimonadota bacterium]MDD2682688.1 MoxR family ATPase [Candidatus Cloacimonadota bacterium]